MKLFHLSLFFIIISLSIPAFVLTSFAQESTESRTGDIAQKGEGCYKAEEIDSGKISVFRDNYVPVEYYPESVLWRVSDIIALVLLLSSGLFMVLRNRPRAEPAILTVLALLYFGIIRGGCICPVGAVANITIGLVHPEMTCLYTGLIFLLPLAAAFIAGRIFCTSACPIGAIQHLFQKNNSSRLPAKLLLLIGIFPPLVLAATIWFALKSSCFLICILDPYKPLFFAGNALTNQVSAFLTGGFSESCLIWACGITAWCFLSVALILGYWLPRPFCRLICPYGVVLGVISLVSIRRRVIRADKCNSCGTCAKACPIQAISVDERTGKAYISNYNCIQCGRCLNICKRSGLDHA